ncbi:unnamed protein product [Rangifer tarandus platyrhynchus]|uniref:Uncharacterized protein n=2 Tax=Rangifer tarandus platyrhynchus TaxID=3082113 RepID=A0AC59ZGH5_RANTA|nr:unnamed protein product [Rangifer tarandus platyrhynchus]
MDRGSWLATVHGGHELDTTLQLKHHMMRDIQRVCVIFTLIYNPRIYAKNRVFFLISSISSQYRKYLYKNIYYWTVSGAPLVVQTVKNLPPIWETKVPSLSWEDPLEKGRVTHSSNVAWRIPWT